MIASVDFSGLKFLPGCSAGLDEKTAVLDMEWSGQLEPHVDWSLRLTKHLTELRLGDPMWGFSTPRSPADFVVKGSSANLDAFPFWVVALTIALQRWARQPVWQGAVLASGDNVARLALPYASQDVLPGALEQAARLLILWSQGGAPGVESRGVREARDQWLKSVLGLGWAPATLRFFALARRLGIPTTCQRGMLQLGQGRYAEYLDCNFTGSTGGLALLLVRNKHLTNQVLSRAGIPVPSQWIVATQDAAEKAAQRLNWPVVIKHGNDDQASEPGLYDLTALRSAFDHAHRSTPGRVILEKYVAGERYQLRVVGGVLRLATQRVVGGAAGDDSTGADVTSFVHPDHRALAEAAARAAGLRIAGVEFLCTDISRPWLEVGGVVCEITALSGSPVRWMSTPVRNISSEVVNWLYQNKPPRIPHAVITGVQGDTTAAYMLHHIWCVAGRIAGLYTDDGTWVGAELVGGNEPSSFLGASFLLENPAVEAAVMGLSSDWPLEFGHPCDQYDVVAIPRVQRGLGIDGTQVPGEGAALMRELLSRARDVVVLNADDSGCLEMLDHASPGVRLILVSSDDQNPAIRTHRELGGEALFMARLSTGACVIHAAGSVLTPLMGVSTVSSTNRGLEETNVLIALAVAGAQGLDRAAACHAMKSFTHSPEPLQAKPSNEY
ncbi:MAG: hypothetical protein V4454_14140 [Pseudomonadota bacterium]